MFLPKAAAPQGVQVPMAAGRRHRPQVQADLVEGEAAGRRARARCAMLLGANRCLAAQAGGAARGKELACAKGAPRISARRLRRA